MFEIILPLVFAILVWKYTIRRVNLPPGPTPFPVIGNLPQLAVSGSKAPYEAFHNLAKQYGDIMTVSLGSADAIVLSGYGAMRDLLGKDEWSGRIFEETLKARYLDQRLGILFLEGDPWKDQRRFLLRHLKDLGFGKQASMESIIATELDELLSRLRQQMADGKQAVLYMNNYFNLSVVNVLWSILAGVRYSHDDSKLLTLMEHVNVLMKAGSVGGLSTMFPILKKIAPKMTGTEQEIKAYKTLQSFLRELIREKRSAEDFGMSNSFLDIYLQEIDKFQGDPSTIYTEDQLLMICFDMFVAGSETTSNSLCFAILYMMLHPQVQEKVYQELVSVTGEMSMPTMDHRNKLPYTQAVLMETLRLSNVSPLTIPHTTMSDVTYRNYKVPKNTIVMVNLYSVHMDEKHWGDPRQFRPERFLDSSGHELLRNERLIPFGIGKHSCLGESLASSSLYLYFTTLIKAFKFEIVPGHMSPTAEPILGFTLSPKPFNAVVTKR